jgi:molecular chaperone DnaK
MVSMSYRLGADLGTTFTAAAVANGAGPTMLGLGNRALQVPSVLYLPADGGLIVGEPAERRGLADPARVVREFKRRFGDSVPMLVAGVPFSPQALTAQLLKWVVGMSTERMGEPPSRVVLTHPANWGPFKRELLTQVIELADVGEVDLCSEPEAAAIQYAVRAGVTSQTGSPVRTGEKVAVYDLGGGTFDSCVLERTDDGFAVLGEPIGIEHLGGMDFDDALFEQVLSSLGAGAQELDLADEQGQAALARLRRDCVEAKEALSADVATVVHVSLPGLNTSVRLNRSELEELIRRPLEETVAAVGRALRSAGVEPGDLRSIVLVGGGSRIPLVSQMLQQEFGVPLALDTHPKHDIALGAAMAGAPLRTPGPSGVPGQQPLPDPSATSVLSPPAPPAPDPAREGSKWPGQQWLPPGWARAGVVAAAVAGSLALIFGVLSLTKGDDNGRRATTLSATSSTTPSSTPTDTPTTTAGPTATPSSNVPALPASAPLADEQLVVPMRVGENWDIYLADVRAAAPVKPLTDGPQFDTYPVVSQDRRSIIFVRRKGKVGTLRVMAADGTGNRKLFTQVPKQCAGTVMRPAWNPVDRTQIAVACADARGSWGMYLLRTDGKVLKKLAVDEETMDDPAFSPDGRSIAFWAGPYHPLDGGSLFLGRVDDGSVRPLTKPRSTPGSDADPAYSPDGSVIVFRRRFMDGSKWGNLDLLVIPATGSGSATKLTNTPMQDQEPSWSPDGEQVAFKSNQLAADGKKVGPKTRIWVTDGTTTRLLWTRPGGDQETGPAWTRR